MSLTDATAVVNVDVLKTVDLVCQPAAYRVKAAGTPWMIMPKLLPLATAWKAQQARKEACIGLLRQPIVHMLYSKEAVSK